MHTPKGIIETDLAGGDQVTRNRKLTPLMRRFEEETGKKAIWQGKVTKQFKKWKEKPPITCGYCGEEFRSLPKPFSKWWKNPVFCNVCLYNAHIYRSRSEIAYKKSQHTHGTSPETVFDEEFEKPSRQQMITDLRKFTEEIGFIPRSYILKSGPSRDFYEKCNPEEVIPLLIDYQMAWYKDYKEEFGSWMKSLHAADILNKEDAIETPYGYRCLADDGHECLSLDERKIDNFLNEKGIDHEKEPSYPPDDDLNPKVGLSGGGLRADWKVGKYFIEFFGLMMDKDYAEKAEKKKRLAEKYGIKLIPIYPKDLGRLEEKLRPLL